MDSIEKIDDLHASFHDLLGRLTKIRTALWEIQQSSSVNPEILQVASHESEQLVFDIDKLKSRVYFLLNKSYVQNSHR